MTRRDDLVRLRDAVEAWAIPASDLDAFVPCFGLSTTGNDAHMAYRGSLDAAKALHDATIPGAFWHIGHLDEPSLGYVATVAHGHYADSPSWRGFNMCPARAWLIAILETLIAQEEPTK
jgi:hypothetical protein